MMIRNQWYVVLESNEVKKKKPIGTTRMGEKLVFWRAKSGVVHCAFDRCPHRGVALSLGKCVDDHLQCPFHGFEYDEGGRCVLIPANGRGGRIPKSLQLRNYPTNEAHGFIWIWWGDSPPEELEPPIFFDNLDDSFVYASSPDYWKAHYSRVIENQLDVVHLPFIHHNTIGRGNRTVVDGPVVRWESDMKFNTYVFNREDDGIPPRKPKEISLKESSSVHLEFIMPNLWQNYISDDVRVMAAFTPVDDDNTILYLRFYQRFMKFPGLGKLIT
jgi:phenylpropionate dioxygenase-like ring-hydroxylating dioxygenase large terminal subunit